MSESIPVVLDLAPLPREQIGPFFLLGLEKDADSEQIEASWAKRVIGARKKQFSVGLEEINWAREVLRDPDRRARADASSLNVDTADRAIQQLAERYSAAGPTWQPLEYEKPLPQPVPPVEVPTLDEVRGRITIPEVPAVPSVGWLLDEVARQPLDPWDENLLGRDNASPQDDQRNL